MIPYNANLQDYVNIVKELSDRYIRVLLAGHNPTIEQTVEFLTATPDAIVLSTCALAHLSIPLKSGVILIQKQNIRLS